MKSEISRRRFLELSLGLCLLTAGCSPSLFTPAEPNDKVLESLAEVVLPTALSKEQRLTATTRFWKWVEGYREFDRRLTPWGFPIQVAPRYQNQSELVLFYRRQLDELSWAAKGAFVKLTRAEREELIRDALSDVPEEAELLPWPTALIGTDLHHVSLALASHYFYSAAGRNFVQGRSVDPFQCRSLDDLDKPPA